MTSKPREYSVCTLLSRPDIDGNMGDFDVVVHFAATVSGRHYPATRDDPAEYAEIEITFLRAEFDRGEPEDAPYPMTPDEIARLAAWLESRKGRDEACEVVERDAPDDGSDTDYDYEMRRDERMARIVL